MTLDQLIERFRLQVPDAVSSAIPNSVLTTLFNEACDKINLLIRVYNNTFTFTMTENVQTYSLSSVAPTMLVTGKSKARYLDSNSKYQRLWPKTRAYMDERVPSWLDADAGEPQFYWFDGDEFWVHPKPSATRSSGFKLYGPRTAVAMSNGGHFPWVGTTTEIKAFRPLDLAIVAYARWQISPSLGKDAKGQLDYQGFIEEVVRGSRQVKRRPDLSHSSTYNMEVSA